MIAYAADAAELYGKLYHWPKSKHDPNNDVVKIYDWDSGKYLGSIPQVAETYNVIGNTNEYQLTIAETTFGGLEELSSQQGAVIDYGNLIWITLMRAKTAREAIKVMTDLVATYGYASEGESFSIGDPNELWILELIGKGNGFKGAVWVAQKLPNGVISAHANQARITQFNQNDDKNVIYASDVITFARKKGYYSGNDQDFSFSDVYDPISFEGTRFCEARVWNFFKKYQTDDFKHQYFDYVRGYNFTNRMPLYVTPLQLLTFEDVMDSFRSHYEDTWFSMFNDYHAQLDLGLVNRWRPLTWQIVNDTNEYCNERPVSTQQTGWNFIAEMRPWHPYSILV